jgi:hypothetical protein
MEWGASQLVHSTKILLMHVKETKEGPIGEILIMYEKYRIFVQKQNPKV